MSPNNTYRVILTEENATNVPNYVMADVLKNGRLFLSGLSLDSARDASEIPFTTRYAQPRWVTENIVAFHRAEYLDMPADLIEVQNETAQSVKYLHVESLNQFLIFDMQPGTLTAVDVPAPRGDSQWIAVEGIFTNGTQIHFKSESFDRPRSRSDRFIYQLLVRESGPVIKVKQL